MLVAWLSRPATVPAQPPVIAVNLPAAKDDGAHRQLAAAEAERDRLRRDVEAMRARLDAAQAKPEVEDLPRLQPPVREKPAPEDRQEAEEARAEARKQEKLRREAEEALATLKARLAARDDQVRQARKELAGAKERLDQVESKVAQTESQLAALNKPAKQAEPPARTAPARRYYGVTRNGGEAIARD